MEKVKTNDNYYELIDIGRFFFPFYYFYEQRRGI